MVKGVAFVGYPVTDMARARKFYEEVLGLAVETEFGEEFVEYAIGDGTTLSLGKMDGWNPVGDGSHVALEVEDYDKAMDKLKAHDVKFHMETEEFPNCRMSIILDTEGNWITIHKRK